MSYSRISCNCLDKPCNNHRVLRNQPHYWLILLIYRERDMPIAVNAYLINSNVHVYRSRMTLMDSEFRLEQLRLLVFIQKCFVGSLRHLEYECILLDSDCLHSWFSITNHRRLKRAIADDRHNIYTEAWEDPMSAKTNCISVDERQVHDIFSINHDQSALGVFWLELREVFTFFLSLISWFIA